MPHFTHPCTHFFFGNRVSLCNPRLSSNSYFLPTAPDCWDCATHVHLKCHSFKRENSRKDQIPSNPIELIASVDLVIVTSSLFMWETASHKIQEVKFSSDKMVSRCLPVPSWGGKILGQLRITFLAVFRGTDVFSCSSGWLDTHVRMNSFNWT